jgi:hypothetical protein
MESIDQNKSWGQRNALSILLAVMAAMFVLVIVLQVT